MFLFCSFRTAIHFLKAGNQRYFCMLCVCILLLQYMYILEQAVTTLIFCVMLNVIACCVSPFLLIFKKNIFNSFQPQLVLNLFLFFRRFDPHCSY